MMSLKGEQTMKNNGFWRVSLTVLLSLTLLISMAMATAAEVKSGFRKGEVTLVTEKDEAPKGLVAVRNGTITTLDALDWEDGGIHGQAVRLNGAGDYIEYGNQKLCSGEITVAGWVNWFGSVVDDPNAALNQQLFTVYRDADNYFTLNLHGYRDNVRTTEEGTVYRIDGVYLEYKIAGSAGKHIEAFNATTGGVDYAIRQNEWTHMAITLSKHAIKLYINGVHWFEEPLENANKTLGANGVRIGGTVGDNAYTLAGLVDDVAVFKGILDGETIAYLAQGATLDFQTPTPVPTPTGVIAAETSEEEGGDSFRDVDNSGAFSDITIPGFTWVVLAVTVVLMIVMTIVLNKHVDKRKREAEKK